MGSPVDDALDRLEREIDLADHARDWNQNVLDLATVRRSLEQLREERDEYAERLAWHRDERDAYLKGNVWVTRAAEEQARAEAAEAEVQRLTEGLREIERMAGAAGYGETPAKPIARKARFLLLGEGRRCFA